MREVLALAAVAALLVGAPQATGSTPVAAGPVSAAAQLAITVALVDEVETCEARGFRTVCIPRCKDMPLSWQWGSIDEEPGTKGECLAQCIAEVNAQCVSQQG